MIKYIVKRIMYMVIVFAIMSAFLFSLYSLVPGDPARAEVESLKDMLTAEEYQMQYQMARERLGLDDPTYVRYFKWAGSALQGDLGQSRVFKKPVLDVIKTPFKVTIIYNVFVLALTFLITIPLGIITAINKNSIFDKIVQVVTVIGYSIPAFIFALLFIYVFAVKLGKFPVSGMGTPNFQGTEWEAFKDMVWHLTLPILALTSVSLGGMTRFVRANMIDALSMECIRTARAKGLKERVVVLSHAWRNALLGVITIMITTLMRLFTGSLILETMFNINGMGKFLLTSLMSQDYNVVIALNLFYIILALFSNLLVDLSYGIVDPRVRVSK